MNYTTFIFFCEKTEGDMTLLILPRNSTKLQNIWLILIAQDTQNPMWAVADPESMLLMSEEWYISAQNKNYCETGLNKPCTSRNADSVNMIR